MSWVPASWVEMRGLQRGVGQRISKEKRRFEKLRPPTESEASRLIQDFISKYGVHKGPDAEQRKSMWGLG